MLLDEFGPYKPKTRVVIKEDRDAVAGAVAHRIMNQRLDLIKTYGVDKVIAAIDDVADFVGDVEEIGTSDVSGWVKQVERTLQSMGPRESSDPGVAEGSVTKKPQPYNEPNWVKKLPKEKLDAIAGPKYKKDKKETGVAEGFMDTIKGAARELTRDSLQRKIKQAWERTFWPRHVEPALNRIQINGRPFRKMVLGEPRMIENDRSQRALLKQYTVNIVFPIDPRDWAGDEIKYLEGQLQDIQDGEWNPKVHGLGLVSFDQPMKSFQYTKGETPDLVIPVRITSLDINRGLVGEQGVAEGMMSEIDIDLHALATRGDEEDLIAALEGDLGPGTAVVLQNMMEELKDELAAKGMTDVINDHDKMIEILWDKILDEYSDGDIETMESLRPGEFHTAQVTFDDGSKATVRLPSDEGYTDMIRSHFAKQGKTVKDIKVDWSVRSNESRSVTAEEVSKYLAEMKESGYDI